MSEPSPNQPPALMPVSVDTLPSGEVTDIFISPSMTPIQCSTGWPMRHTKLPAGICRSNESTTTRSSSAGVSMRPHTDWWIVSSSVTRCALASDARARCWRDLIG
jgi:hypothetical protein